MMGRTHAASGAVAFLALAWPAHKLGMPLDPATAIAGAVAAAGGAMLPDLDHPSATASNCLGPVSRALANILHEVSGGHRQGTHSFMGIAFFTGCALAADIAGGVVLGLWLAFLFAIAIAALRMRIAPRLWIHTALCLVGGVMLFTESTVGSFLLGILTLAVTVGASAHIVGDLLTREGCPLLWPFSGHRFRIARLKTNGPVERLFIGPGLWVAAVVLAAAQAIGL